MKFLLPLMIGVVWLVAGSWGNPLLAAGSQGRLEVRVVDKDGGQPLAARMHLKDVKGKPVKPPKVPYWKDHFVFDGSITLELPPGTYTFEMETGPEYRTQTGYFQLERGAEDTKTVEMNRFVEMKKEGWWSGDLHIHRRRRDRAADAGRGFARRPGHHLVEQAERCGKSKPLPEPSVVGFDSDRFYHLLAGEDERDGGALSVLQLEQAAGDHRRRTASILRH